VWQLPQVLLVIVSKCALEPVVGIPAVGATLFAVPWQPDAVQLLAALMLPAL
jgi:hypothetical protein